MTDHPDAELLRLGRDFERLLQAGDLLRQSETYGVKQAVSSHAYRVMKEIHRLQPSTVEGVAVKLRALCFDFADLDSEGMDLKNGDVAEAQLGRLMRHMQRLAKGRGTG